MDNPNEPLELLTCIHIENPLLLKIYNYTRIVYINGIANKTIKQYFSRQECIQIINAIKKHPNYEIQEIKFDSGIYEKNMNLISFQNRVLREFRKSGFRKYILTPIEKIWRVSPTTDEYNTLEYLFYDYASEIFGGFHDDPSKLRTEFQRQLFEIGVSASFQKKEEQLIVVNELFSCLYSPNARYARQLK